MAFDDKDIGLIFPTRTGNEIGSSNERRMLDNVGGANQIRRKLRENPDGSITLMKTRAGNPEFITTTAKTNGQDASIRAYMETGQLGWSFPGVDNPERLYPAKWYFMGVNTGAKYLGKIDAGTGSQKNAPALTDGMDSLAIGYPRSADTAIDDANRAEYGDSTVAKKLLIGIFPSSIFSGKMRKFIQAQYGSAETSVFPYAIDVVGTEATLNYWNGPYPLQLTYYSTDSTGILCTQHYEYFILKVAISTAPNFSLTIFPITFSKTGKAIRRFLKKGTATADVKEKLESYMLCDAVIETNNPQIIGSFSVGDYAYGVTLGYGWKFDSSGMHGAVVKTHLLDNGTVDARFSSVRISFSISMSPDQYAPNRYDFTVTSESTSPQEWTDGWGAYNIFVPGGTLDPQLSLFSCATDYPNVKPSFNFYNVEVYGYYVNDVWTPVLISRSVGNTTEYYHTHHNLTFPDDFTYVESTNWIDHAATPTGQGSYYRKNTVTYGGTMDISFGDFSYNGVSEAHSIFESETSVESLTEPTGYVTINFASRQDLTFVPINDPPGWATYVANGELMDSEGRGPYPEFSPYVERLHGVATRVTNDYSYGTFKTWALVIPRYDSEAVYIATSEIVNGSTGMITTTHHGSFQAGDAVWGWANIPSEKVYLSTVRTYLPSVVVFGADVSITSETTLVNTTTNYSVVCFNKVANGIIGYPGGSYESLFNVSKFYPFYDRGFTMQTGIYNYIGSEGIKTHASLTADRRFVGWA